jgi:hypothetical protein
MTLELVETHDRPKVRDSHGRIMRTPEQIERDHQAAAMKSRGAKLREIGEHFGVAISTAHEMISRAIADIPRADTEQLIAMELMRLDAIEAKYAEITQGLHPMVSVSGKIIGFTDDNGETTMLEDTAPVIRALDGLLKVSESRRKLLGLNAPTRTELTGKDGGAIEIADRSKEARDSVLQLLSRLADVIHE